MREGAYKDSTHDEIVGTLIRLRNMRRFVRSSFEWMVDPWSDWRDTLTRDEAQRKLTWLLHVAINRRAGWPDDPSDMRGSCMPVRGRFPKRAGGNYYRDLSRVAFTIRMPRRRVCVSELGECRGLLMKRIPGRFATSWED